MEQEANPVETPEAESRPEQFSGQHRPTKFVTCRNCGCLLDGENEDAKLSHQTVCD